MRLLKTLVAVAAMVLALLVLPATPASATVVGFEVMSGDIGGLPLGSGTGPCNVTSNDTISIDETASGTSWNTTVTAVDITSSLSVGTTSYIVKITKHTGTNTGTISAAGAVVQNLSLKVQFYTASSCVQGTLLCTLQLNVPGTTGTVLTGTTADTPIHTVGDQITGLGGTGRYTTILGQACSAPFATLANTNATLSSINLEVTTPSTTSVLFEIDAGTIGGGAIGATATPPCTRPSPDSITIDEGRHGANWDTLVTALDINTSVVAGTPTATYLVKYTKHTGPNTGKISPIVGTAYPVQQDLSAKVQIYTATGTPPNCVQGTLVCTLQLNVNNTAGATLTGTTTDPPVHTTSEWITGLGGTGRYTTIFPLACSAPFASLANTTTTLSGINLHV